MLTPLAWCTLIVFPGPCCSYSATLQEWVSSHGIITAKTSLPFSSWRRVPTFLGEWGAWANQWSRSKAPKNEYLHGDVQFLCYQASIGLPQQACEAGLFRETWYWIVRGKINRCLCPSSSCLLLRGHFGVPIKCVCSRLPFYSTVGNCECIVGLSLFISSSAQSNCCSRTPHWQLTLIWILVFRSWERLDLHICLEIRFPLLICWDDSGSHVEIEIKSSSMSSKCFMDLQCKGINGHHRIPTTPATHTACPLSFPAVSSALYSFRPLSPQSKWVSVC